MSKKKKLSKKTNRKDQKDIGLELTQWFSGGYSLPFIAQKTGYDVSLIKTHYTEWSEKMEGEIDLEGQKKNALVTLVIQLDKIIERFETQAKEIENFLEKCRNKSDLEFVDLLITIYDDLASIHANKAYFLLHPSDEIRLGELR